MQHKKIKFWTKKLYNEADYLISPSEYTKNLIKSKYLEKDKEVRVISNGVNINKFNKNFIFQLKYGEKYCIIIMKSKRIPAF